MPHHAVAIPETYLTITRRVTRSAITRLMNYFHIPEHTRISILGDSQQTLLWASDTQSFRQPTDKDATKFAQHALFEVTPKEEIIEAFVYANPLHVKDQPPVFHHPDLPLTVFPYKTRTKLTLSCVYRTENREQYTLFYQNLLKTIALTNSEILLELDYKMVLADFVVGALKHSYDLQENVAPYNIGFLDWIAKYSNNHITFAKQMDGTNPHFVVNETLIGVQGWLMDTVPPEGERKESGANYEVSFDFVLEYDKPDQWQIDMPLVIHNQLTNEVYHPKIHYQLGRRKALRTCSRFWFDMIHETHNELYRAYPNYTRMLRLPMYDDWETNHTPPSSLPMSQMLITLDPNDPQLVCNLYDFELLVTFSENLKRYFRICPKEIFDTKKSPLTIQVYEDQFMIHPELIQMDHEYNIRILKEVDLRKTYHIRMAFCLDWTLLDPNFIQQLCHMPWILDEFLIFQYHDYNIGSIKRIDYQRLDAWKQAFYRDHGRWPTQEEIDEYFSSLHPKERINFFGQIDYKSLMNDWVEKRRVGNKLSSTYDFNKAKHFRYVGLFTVRVDRINP